MAQPSLVRPSQGRIIAGVALAIALRFDWNVTLVRLVTLLLGLFTGVGLLLYLVLWIVIPSGD
jgi:phage shock protein PspC (stress-responsive transcriptional regulator)